jgi:hypothetical protein
MQRESDNDKQRPIKQDIEGKRHKDIETTIKAKTNEGKQRQKPRIRR